MSLVFCYIELDTGKLYSHRKVKSIMTEIELFSKAVAFAANKHKNQTRRDGTTPYLYHVFSVADLVRHAGYGTKYQIVAILHDVLEDTDATDDDVRVFGEDVLQSVKLLTRPSGMDEEAYVNAILNDHMASVVKNADKMHNVWEASYCGDKTWAKKYLKKAMRYYYGKFSAALDHAIGDAEGILCTYNPTKKPLLFSQDEMMLNNDHAMIEYNTQKDLYERCINRPDFTNTNMQYWHSELGNYYFCLLDNNNVWKLTRAGWLPREGNPIQESEYGDDLSRVTRNEIIVFVEKMNTENYFYDFVDTTTI